LEKGSEMKNGTDNISTLPDVQINVNFCRDVATSSVYFHILSLLNFQSDQSCLNFNRC